MCSVLLIDDDPMSRELFTLLLEAEGYTVCAAVSGDAALHLLKTEPWQPDAVLTDLQMPGLTGSALATALHTQCPRCLLIGMSASQPADGTPSGFHAFLLKPFDASAFTRALAGLQAPTMPGQPEECDLDEATAAQLSAAMPAAQLLQLYTLCLSDARKRAAAMAASLAAADDASLRREAHAVKGGASMLGLRSLAARARLLEEQGINADASPRLDAIMELIVRLERMLELRFPLE